MHGDTAVGAGVVDYAVLGLFGYMALAKPVLAIPLSFLMWKAPARVMISRYFVLHAELMPHTEQVIFVKAALFGNRVETVVDIKNLEKINEEAVSTGIVNEVNMINPDMIFKDKESGEIFMFSTYGQWNEETLKHPLLY